MAKRKIIEVTGGDETAGRQVVPDRVTPELAAPAPSIAASAEHGDLDAKAAAKAAAKAELLRSLPAVESPSVSPAVSEPVSIDEPAVTPKPEPEVEAAQRAPSFALVPVPAPAVGPAAEAVAQPAPRFVFKTRHKRYARLAASVAIGAALGAIGGILLTGGFAGAPHSNVAAVEENKAMQQSLTRLAKDVTTLKANLDATKKLAQNEAAKAARLESKIEHNAVAKLDPKIDARIDHRAPMRPDERVQSDTDLVTGSISAPPSVVAPPLPRPAPRLAMADSQPPARQQVVQGWSIRDARGGYIYVEGHGDVYQIVPGAPLPGLGPVESVRRLEGRWIVTTPKGIIVSMRDRHYFE